MKNLWRIFVTIGMALTGILYISFPEKVPDWLIRVSGVAWVVQAILEVISMKLEKILKQEEPSKNESSYNNSSNK